jgi:hypothetical protein
MRGYYLAKFGLIGRKTPGDDMADKEVPSTRSNRSNLKLDIHKANYKSQMESADSATSATCLGLASKERKALKRKSDAARR